MSYLKMLKDSKTRTSLSKRPPKEKEEKIENTKLEGERKALLKKFYKQ